MLYVMIVAVVLHWSCITGAYICQNSLNLNACVLYLNCTSIKLFLRRTKSTQGTALGCGLVHWPVFTHSPADFNTVWDKVMTAFSSEKPAQLFLRRKAKWEVLLSKNWLFSGHVKIWRDLLREESKFVFSPGNSFKFKRICLNCSLRCFSRFDFSLLSSGLSEHENQIRSSLFFLVKQK